VQFNFAEMVHSLMGDLRSRALKIRSTKENVVHHVHTYLAKYILQCGTATPSPPAIYFPATADFNNNAFELILLKKRLFLYEVIFSMKLFVCILAVSAFCVINSFALLQTTSLSRSLKLSQKKLLLSRQASTNNENKHFDGKTWLKTAAIALSFLSFSVPAFPSSTLAADTVKVGKCLLQSCQKELAQCILNPKCLANVICLNTCNGRKDEAECQIKCGDLLK